MKDFKKLRIWQKGFEIAVKTIQFVTAFPKEQKFALAIQMTKSSVSIPSNIAEGSSRTSEKDYNRFIEISLGSSYELETQLLIADAVNYGDPQLRKHLLEEIQDEQKMLTGFASKLHC